MDFTQQLPIQDGDSGVKIPMIRYKTTADIGADKVFTGSVVPIPSVLVEYLDKTELKIFAIVLKQIRERGICYLRVESIARNLGLTAASISNATSRLRKMGILTYVPYGKKREKIINFNAIQMLEDLMRDKKPGAIPALRKRNNLQNIEQTCQRNIDFINKNYSWHDDPDEDEEYN